MAGVTYDGAEPPPLRRDYEPCPELIGFDGPPLLALMGYRGPYVPRVPVLFGQVVPLHRQLPQATPQQRAEVWTGGPGDSDGAIPVNTDEDAPDTLRSPPSQLPPPSRQPVPVTEASGTRLTQRRTRRDGPRPQLACVVCERKFTPKSPTQCCCDRACGGVYRSNKRHERAGHAGLRWPVREVGT